VANIPCTKNKNIPGNKWQWPWGNTFSVPGHAKSFYKRPLPFFCAAKIKYHLSVILSPKLVIIYGRHISLTKGNYWNDLMTKPKQTSKPPICLLWVDWCD